jgi:hypothetical protein
MTLTMMDRATKARIEEAIASLVSVRADGNRARITLPLLYPSGAGCSVEVTVNGENCFVSDFGFGAMEAEMQGADSFYDSHARKAADHFGVGFDGMSIFAAWAALGRMDAAVIAVANASVQAATWAIMSASEERERRDNAELFERVREYFGERAVSKRGELSGRDAKWQVHNVVALASRKRAVFEFVTTHTNSISNKYMMFSDLSRLEDTYSLNSVVRSIPRMGNKGAMLAGVSHVIELDSPRETYVRFAEVA